MNPKVWPAAILGIALALRLLLFTGVQGNDDRLYSLSAWQMSRGEKPAGPDLFRTRVAYVAPVAVLYKTFGVHYAWLLLPNLLASLVLVGLAYRMGLALYGPIVGRVAGGFVALCPLDIFYATMGGTDPLLAAFIGTGLWLVVDAGLGRKTLCAVLAGLAWGCAHLTKESGLFLLLPAVPLLLYHADRRSLLIAGGVVVGVLACEMLIYGVAQGDPLFRFHVARETQQDPFDPYPGFGTRLLLFPRICLNPFEGLYVYTGGLMMLAAVGTGWACVRDRRRSGVIAAWWLASGLFLCLFPSSLFPYKAALQLQPRMFAALTLPAALLAAASLTEGSTRWPARIAGAIVALLSISCAVRLHEDGLGWRRTLEWGRARVEEHPGATFVTDPRSAQTLTMMFGYAPPASLRGFGPADPAPAAGTLLLELSALENVSRTRDGVSPPPWWSASIPPRTTVVREEVPGRERIRGGQVPPELRVLHLVGP